MRQVTLYVPENDNDGNLQPDAVEWILRGVIRLAGGATIVRAEGAWIGSRLFREPVVLISAIIEDGASLAPFRDLAGTCRDMLQQESALFTVTNGIYGEFV